MLRFPGKQKDSNKYFHNGYVYYIDTRNNSYSFRCKEKNGNGCTGRAYVGSLLNLETATVSLAGQHNHDPDPYLLLREEFDEEVLTLATTTFDTLKDLYDKTYAKEK